MEENPAQVGPSACRGCVIPEEVGAAAAAAEEVSSFVYFAVKIPGLASGKEPGCKEGERAVECSTCMEALPLLSLSGYVVS